MNRQERRAHFAQMPIEELRAKVLANRPHVGDTLQELAARLEQKDAENAALEAEADYYSRLNVSTAPPAGAQHWRFK